MGVYLFAIMYGIPALIFVIWVMTPRGQKWLRSEDDAH